MEHQATKEFISMMEAGEDDCEAIHFATACEIYGVLIAMKVLIEARPDIAWPQPPAFWRTEEGDVVETLFRTAYYEIFTEGMMPAPPIRHAVMTTEPEMAWAILRTEIALAMDEAK